MAAASEDSSLSFLLLPLLTHPWPVLEPIRLAPAPHFQLFQQASKLISVIKSGHLWQQLGAGEESQGFEACQLSVKWSAASPCGTLPGLEDSCLRLPGHPWASAGPGSLGAGVLVLVCWCWCCLRATTTRGMGLAAPSRNLSRGVRCSWSAGATLPSTPDWLWPQGKGFSLADPEVQVEG